MKAIATRYLEGTATDGEAARLLAYIQSGEQAMRTFRQWEREWTSQRADARPDADTAQAWAQTQSRLRADAPHHARPHTPRVIAPRWWRQAVAAAAVLLLVVCGATWLTRRQAQAARAITCQAQAGTRQRLTLPDGSEVWLNGGSTLTYSSRFNTDNRRVTLRGEAYFEVRKHEGKPFTVHTNGYDVTVKGTRFNVSAYDDDPTSTTTLMEGRVELTRHARRIDLRPGQAARLDKASGRLRRAKADTQADGWRQGRLVYTDISLEQFARVMARQYGVKVSIATPQCAGTRISVMLQNNETIDEVVTALRHVTGHDVELSEGTVSIR